MVREIVIERKELCDYELINGEWYIKTSKIVKSLYLSPNIKGKISEFLDEELGMEFSGDSKH